MLPFLDILVIRENNNLELDIYRKPTHTKRDIPFNSNHSVQHKMASFNHMVHSMLTLPLKEDATKRETSFIYTRIR